MPRVELPKFRTPKPPTAKRSRRAEPGEPSGSANNANPAGFTNPGSSSSGLPQFRTPRPSKRTTANSANANSNATNPTSANPKSANPKSAKSKSSKSKSKSSNTVTIKPDPDIPVLYTVKPEPDEWTALDHRLYSDSNQNNNEDEDYDQLQSSSSSSSEDDGYDGNGDDGDGDEDDGGRPSMTQRLNAFGLDELPKSVMRRVRVGELYDALNNDEIVLDPPYQRDVVWNLPKRTGLIDSIFRNFYIPPVVFAIHTVDVEGVDVEGDIGGDGVYGADGDMGGAGPGGSGAGPPRKREIRICVDGKQRLTSIRNFIDGKIPFKHTSLRKSFWYTDASSDDDADDEDGGAESSSSLAGPSQAQSQAHGQGQGSSQAHGPGQSQAQGSSQAHGQGSSQAHGHGQTQPSGTSKKKKSRKHILPQRFREVFDDKEISVVEYRHLTDSLERDLFRRVQLGMSLNSAEKLQAISSPWADWITSLENKHLEASKSLGKLITIDSSRGRGFLNLTQLIWACEQYKNRTVAAVGSAVPVTAASMSGSAVHINTHTNPPTSTPITTTIKPTPTHFTTGAPTYATLSTFLSKSTEPVQEFKAEIEEVLMGLREIARDVYGRGWGKCFGKELGGAENAAGKGKGKGKTTGVGGKGKQGLTSRVSPVEFLFMGATLFILPYSLLEAHISTSASQEAALDPSTAMTPTPRTSPRDVQSNLLLSLRQQARKKFIDLRTNSVVCKAMWEMVGAFEERYRVPVVKTEEDVVVAGFGLGVQQNQQGVHLQPAPQVQAQARAQPLPTPNTRSRVDLQPTSSSSSSMTLTHQFAPQSEIYDFPAFQNDELNILQLTESENTEIDILGVDDTLMDDTLNPTSTAITTNNTETQYVQHNVNADGESAELDEQLDRQLEVLKQEFVILQKRKAADEKREQERLREMERARAAEVQRKREREREREKQVELQRQREVKEKYDEAVRLRDEQARREGEQERERVAQEKRQEDMQRTMDNRTRLRNLLFETVEMQDGVENRTEVETQILHGMEEEELPAELTELVPNTPYHFPDPLMTAIHGTHVVAPLVATEKKRLRENESANTSGKGKAKEVVEEGHLENAKARERTAAGEPEAQSDGPLTMRPVTVTYGRKSMAETSTALVVPAISAATTSTSTSVNPAFQFPPGTKFGKPKKGAKRKRDTDGSGDPRPSLSALHTLPTLASISPVATQIPLTDITPMSLPSSESLFTPPAPSVPVSAHMSTHAPSSTQLPEIDESLNPHVKFGRPHPSKKRRVDDSASTKPKMKSSETVPKKRQAVVITRQESQEMDDDDEVVGYLLESRTEGEELELPMPQSAYRR